MVMRTAFKTYNLTRYFLLGEIHTPRHREIATKEFAPKGWEAICEIFWFRKN